MHLIDPDYRNDFVLYCEHSFKRLNKQKSSVRKKKIRFLEEQALCDIHIHKPDLVSMASDTIIGQEEGSFLCFYSLLNHYKKERYTTVNGSAFRLVSYIKDTALIWHGWFKSI